MDERASVSGLRSISLSLARSISRVMVLRIDVEGRRDEAMRRRWRQARSDREDKLPVYLKGR